MTERREQKAKMLGATGHVEPMKTALVYVLFLLSACSGTRNGNGSPDLESFFTDGGAGTHDAAGASFDGSACGAKGCYAVYAHSDHILYKVDLSTHALVEVGAFKAPKVGSGSGSSEDVITDLAVATNDTIYVISHASLYTADANDGHVTKLGDLSTCGTEAVALSFTPDGSLYAGDYKGAFCKIDPSASPPAITQVGTMDQGLALAGDLVAVADGTMYGTAYKLSDASNKGTQNDNLLVKIDPATGHVLQQLGATGYPKLFGAAYALGQVFAFTHDGSGDVVTIDPATGVGTLFNSFKDTGGMGISFAGAGVNALVPPTIL